MIMVMIFVLLTEINSFRERRRNINLPLLLCIINNIFIINYWGFVKFISIEIKLKIGEMDFKAE